MFIWAMTLHPQLHMSDIDERCYFTFNTLYVRHADNIYLTSITSPFLTRVLDSFFENASRCEAEIGIDPSMTNASQISPTTNGLMNRFVFTVFHVISSSETLTRHDGNTGDATIGIQSRAGFVSKSGWPGI